MKRLIFWLLTLFFFTLFSCDRSVNFDPTSLVQVCLNEIKTGRYGFSDTKNLILVKDDYSAHLKTLYYGKNKLTLETVPKQKIKYYYSPGDDTTKVYITARYKKQKTGYVFTSIEVNHNCLFRFYFRAHENTWKIESSFVDIH